MTTIVTRSGKGSPLSWVEADANLTNLNTDKLEASALAPYLTSATAASTYETQTHAASTYETQTHAASTYETQTHSSSTYPTKANNLSDLTSASTARTNLGLGTAATQTSTAFAASGAVTGNGNTMTTARLLGRTTASTGAIEEITVGSGLALTAGTLTATSDTSLLPKVMCIWNGIASGSLSYTRSGTTVTVTHTAHGYNTNAIAEIISATDTGINAVGKVITVIDANTYQFQTTATGANGTLVIRTMIRKSYNVTSITTNSTSDYTLTFTNALSSKDYYITSGGVGNTTGSGGGWGFTPRDYSYVTTTTLRGIWGIQNSPYESNFITLILT